MAFLPLPTFAKLYYSLCSNTTMGSSASKTANTNAADNITIDKYRLCRKLRPERQPLLPLVVPAAQQQPLVIQAPAPQVPLSPPATSIYPSAPPLPPSMQKWAQ